MGANVTFFYFILCEISSDSIRIRNISQSEVQLYIDDWKQWKNQTILFDEIYRNDKRSTFLTDHPTFYSHNFTHFHDTVPLLINSGTFLDTKNFLLNFFLCVDTWTKIREL